MYIGCVAAVELNVPRDESAIELTFVTLRRGFKNAGSVLFDIGTPENDFFKIQLHQFSFVLTWDSRVITLRWGKS